MGFGGMLSSMSVVIASGTAIYGISAWKREFRGKRQIELAEETLALFYEAREAITNARSCLGFASEGKTREPVDGETAAEKSARDAAYAIFERLQPHEELFSKLHAMRYRFMARFGVGAGAPFDELRKVRNEILFAARRLGRLWAKDVTHLGEKEQEAHYQGVQKYESIFWDTYDEAEDPINPRLDKAVSEVEMICRTLIMNKARVFPWLRKLWAEVRKWLKK